MLIDTRELESTFEIECDLCIVGGGVAGLTLAREFNGTGIHVCVLESGDTGPDPEIQRLAAGEGDGVPYYDLDECRVRALGGSSHLWGNRIGRGRLAVALAPLDPQDFEQRDWLPDSGWPFTRDDLEPWYQRAHDQLGLEPFDYSINNWTKPPDTPLLELDSRFVKTDVFRLLDKEVFSREYPEAVSRSRNISVCTRATAVEIETDEGGNAITGVRVATHTGNHGRISSRVFVLAAGGIDTPRLLLLSNRKHTKGIGNQFDLVGRYFMEHPFLWWGVLIPAPGQLPRTGFYRFHPADGGKMAVGHLRPQLGPTHPALTLQLQPRPPWLLKKPPEYPWREEPGQHWLNHKWEQRPNAESRVTLSDSLDTLGQPKPRLRWQVHEEEYKLVLKCCEILDEAVRQKGYGHVQFNPDLGCPPEGLHGGRHHMGTTRMHASPKLGVTDGTGRVHGMKNLYVTGSSLFPTGGCNPPTLTIIALSLRLAALLKREVRSSGRVASQSPAVVRP